MSFEMLNKQIRDQIEGKTVINIEFTNLDDREAVELYFKYTDLKYKKVVLLSFNIN